MTTTSAPKPLWTFLEKMTPSFNACLIAIVTAVVSVSGTLITKRYTDVAPPAPKVAVVNTAPAGLVARVDALEAIARRTEAKIDEALAKRAARPARKK